MTDLNAKLAALPEWPNAADPISDGMFYRRMSAAYSQRLALAREWIEMHGNRWTSGGKNSGRDALLAALEVPK